MKYHFTIVISKRSRLMGFGRDYHRAQTLSRRSRERQPGENRICLYSVMSCVLHHLNGIIGLSSSAG